MSARDDYPWHAAMEQLNQHSGIASALDEIDRLRKTAARLEADTFKAVATLVAIIAGCSRCTLRALLRVEET